MRTTLHNTSRHILRVAISLVALAWLGVAHADTRTWGGVNTNWNDANNWSGTVVPTNGDAVVIPNITARPSMPSGTYPSDGGAFLSFTIQVGATNTCLGNTNVINEASGGTAAKPHGTGVTINCGSAVIDGTLNTDAQGFTRLSGGYGGPGCDTSSQYPAGAHGGRAGGNTNAPYGQLKQPMALGSSDAWIGVADFSRGGGAIRLNVSGALTLNGTITACGGAKWSGSAGGSIWLSAASLQGNGAVKANGGSAASTAYQNAGGGRVAIEYSSSTFTGSVSVAGGTGPGTAGQPGTLWEINRFPGNGNVVITNSYQYFCPTDAVDRTWALTLTKGATVYLHDFTNGTLNITNLAMDGRSILRFDVDAAGIIGKAGINNAVFSNITLSGTSSLYAADGSGGGSFVVTDRSTGDFSICSGTFATLGSVQVTNAGSTLNFGPQTHVPALTSITLATTNTALYLPGQEYNLTGDFYVPSGAVLYARGDTSSVNYASGGATNLRHGVGVTMIVSGSMTVDGAINGNGLGFSGALNGWPGPGITSIWGAAGSHGGLSGANGRTPYGRLDSPTALGSGDYSYNGGGSAIKLNVANTLTVNGAVTANGNPSNQFYSGGSGGSVWLASALLQGSGIVSAVGGRANTPSYASGGGGRVALEYTSSTFSGTLSVAQGTGGAYTGKVGTVFLCQTPQLGTTSSNGVNGRQLYTQFSVSSNDVQIARSVMRFDTSLQWSDYSTTTSGSFVVTNIAIYTISGLRPSRGYAVYLDGAVQFGGQLLSSTNGVLTFTNTLNVLRNFLVTPAEQGTVFKIH